MSSPPNLVHRDHDDVANLVRHFTEVDRDLVLRPPDIPAQIVPPMQPPGLPDPVVGHNPELHALSRERFVAPIGNTQAFDPNGSTLGQKHSRRDPALSKMSYRERIVLKDGPEPDRAHHRRHSKKLLRGFHKFTRPGNYRFDEGLWTECYNERLSTWLSHKTRAQIIRALGSDTVVLPREWLRMFIKTQDVKKIDAALSSVKKAQTISDMSPSAQFQDQVWALYVEKQLLRHKHDHVYLHIRQNHTTMQDWYSTHWHGDGVTYNDYTGWDRGVDRSFTLLYKEIYASYGVPRSIIDMFGYTRTHSRSHLGEHSDMEPSGGRPTWLNNTMGNMAETGLRVDPAPTQPFCFSGDDMITTRCRMRDNPHSTFIAKTVHANEGEFCGYMFGGPQLHISPRVLLHRGKKALEDGRNDPDYWRSYDQSLHFASHDDFYPSPAYDTAHDISRTAHEVFRLPLTDADAGQPVSRRSGRVPGLLNKARAIRLRPPAHGIPARAF
jgi:hypothetical protein